MRLLNTETLALESFSASPPPYAILSHTWGPDEVLFEDINNGTARQKQAFPKIENCCRIAAGQGYEYAWIDTCCIDKSSSAELSEAINSMFNWYRDSAVAYAYLEDLTLSKTYYTVDELKSCGWFERGWTLQELIAPKTLQFYDGNWAVFGTRHELREPLSTVTGISTLILLDGGDITARLLQFSVYQRFSWAAHRETTRPEDMAYSLMGLFDVNLPLLYGEGGKKSFFRLQEEILKYSMDQSILAWRPPVENADRTEVTGVLADSVARFPAIFPAMPYRPDRGKPCHMTNKGLSMTVPLVSASYLMINENIVIPKSILKTNTVFAVLDCHLQTAPSIFICIPLAAINFEVDPFTAETFAQWNSSPLLVVVQGVNTVVPRTIYISHSREGRVNSAKQVTFFVTYYWFWDMEVFPVSPDKAAINVLRAIPADRWMPGHRMLQTSTTAAEAARGAALITAFGHHNKVVVSFGEIITNGEGFVVLLDPEETEEASWLIADGTRGTFSHLKIFPDGVVVIASILTKKVMGDVVKEVSVISYQTQQVMVNVMGLMAEGGTNNLDMYVY